MKRFFSLALALCLIFSVASVSALAITTTNITVRGAVNEPVDLPASIFLSKITAENLPMVSLTVTSLPNSRDGELRVGGTPVAKDVPIAWASLSSLAFYPVSGFRGTTDFLWTVKDSSTTSSNARATMDYSVERPTAKDQTVSVGTYHGSVSGTLTSVDPNSPVLSLDYIIETYPTKGVISRFDRDTGAFTYTHNSDSLGTDSFTFRSTNGYRESNTATVTVTLSPPEPDLYRDMTSHWAGFSAGVLRSLDIAVGEKIQDYYYFNPTKPVTRAEFARFLNSVFDIPLSTNKVSRFVDVTEAHLVETVNALYERGISSGTAVGTNLYFYPNKQLTRIEAMKMVDNAMKFANPGTEALTFADRHLIPTWGVQAVKDLVSHKIVTGSNGYLRPTENITRAEVAQLLYLAYVERKK